MELYRQSTWYSSQLYTDDYSSKELAAKVSAGQAVKPYSYDLAGNIISDGSTSYTYNTGGRLSRIDRAGKTNWYFYNAFGERVAIKAGAWLVMDLIDCIRFRWKINR